MVYLLKLGVGVTIALAGLVYAQAGPNTLLKQFPFNRTMSINATYCIVPISKSDAQKIAKFAPLDIPKEVLPSFPKDKHLMIVHSGFASEVHMMHSSLFEFNVDSMMLAGAILPYMDVTGDKRTPINVNVASFVGGTYGNKVAIFMPAINSGMSPIDGANTLPADIQPDTAATNTNADGVFMSRVRPFIVMNPITGHGSVNKGFDLMYNIKKKSPYSPQNFHILLNQPLTLSNKLLCMRNTFWFNETFAKPKMGQGLVTLYDSVFGNLPAAIEGPYVNAHCYQANAVAVAAHGEPCSVAAANMDPASWMQ